MRLLIIRHAPAGGPAAKRRWRGRDRLRPLTRQGEEKMRRAAKGLVEVSPRLEAVYTSPFARARRTAEIVGKRLGAKLVETDALTPEARPEETLALLAGLRGPRGPGGAVALVGHEPQLGRLVAWLCSGAARPLTVLKKGQACLLELPELRPGAARLLWSLAPAQLRRLG